MKKELIINTYEDNVLLFKENLLGEFTNNILKYENETDNFIINTYDKTFYKENLESILKINPNKAEIIIKEIDKTFDISLYTLEINKENNKITIKYFLESQEKPIKIEIEMSDINA